MSLRTHRDRRCGSEPTVACSRRSVQWMSRWRLNLLGGLALSLVACGLGGDWETEYAEPGASIAGRVLLGPELPPGLPPSAATEVEPNDSLDTAQGLGRIEAGDVFVVHGHATAVDDSDPHDGYRFVAPDRVEITATLESPPGIGSGLDLGVFDPVSLQFVEVAASSSATQGVTFYALGVFHLVVTPYEGEADYVLTVQAATSASPVPEIEPNDTLPQAAFVGALTAGDVLHVSGSADDRLDPADGFLIVFPDAIRLDATLVVPPDSDFAVECVDVTQGLSAPVPFAKLEASGMDAPGTTLGVPGGSLLYVEIRSRAGSGTWTLDLRARAPAVWMHGMHQALVGGIVPLHEENRRLRGSTSSSPYGRPQHALVPGHVLVGYEQGETVQVESLVHGQGGVLHRSADARTARVAFEMRADLDPVDLERWTWSRIAALTGRPGILFAEPNYRVGAFAEPDDPHYYYQWHLPLIHLEDAWEVTKGSASVVVAVIDTGRTSHPDLEGRQVGGYDFISDAWSARDGDGRDPDPTDEGDLLGSNGRSSFHGTHVAGTIGAATDNGRGVAGVTWQTQIMHLRVLGRDGGTVEDVAAAIRYAAALPNGSAALPPERAHVINMSLGGGGYSQTLQDAITAARDAGVVIVAAAGNDASNVPSYPAAHAGVLSVSAVDSTGGLAYYSNVGSTIDIAAPGGDTSVDRDGDGYVDGVLSTMLDDSAWPQEVVYAFYQGTSMAAPHVAGVAALVLSVDPSLTAAQVESILLSSARDRGRPGRDDAYGHGLVDAHAAVLGAAGGGGMPPILEVTPEVVQFGPLDDELGIQVTNVGGGFLEILDVTATADGGLRWLDAWTAGSGDASRSVDSIRIRVDRTGLADGIYSGRVTIRTPDDLRDVPVRMSVIGIPDAPVYVLAVDPVTGETVAQVALSPRLSLAFTLRGLAPGSYLVVAGTDLDDDGYLCDEGEWCGRHPVEVRVEAGEFHAGIELTLEAVSSLEGAAKPFAHGVQP